jgi:hypothetical protein
MIRRADYLHLCFCTNATLCAVLGCCRLPELRDLLLFIGAQLEDRDIPHRTKLSEMITTRFKTEYNKMIEDIGVCCYTSFVITYTEH